jgi:hypothetical protein
MPEQSDRRGSRITQPIPMGKFVNTWSEQSRWAIQSSQPIKSREAIKSVRGGAHPTAEPPFQEKLFGPREEHDG